MMDNKIFACCGCSGCGCLILIIALIVGGYFGVSFVKEKGRDFAADAFEESSIKAMKDVFSQDDSKELEKEIKAVAKKIKKGEIGLMKFFATTVKQFQNEIHLKAMILKFKKLHLENLKNSNKISKDDAVKSVDLFFKGLSEGKIRMFDVASLTEIVSEEYHVKSKDAKGNNYKYKTKRLKKNLTPEEIFKSLEVMNYLTSLKGVKDPVGEFYPEKLLKQEILNTLRELQGKKPVSRSSSKKQLPAEKPQEKPEKGAMFEEDPLLGDDDVKLPENAESLSGAN